MKLTFDIVFVTLVYKNFLDLYDLYESLKGNVKSSYQILVVDAFFSYEVSSQIKDVAMSLGCEYLQIQNKGYGYGNNKGIEYVKNNFEYKWLVVCNPDTVLMSKLDISILAKYHDLIAPQIRTRKGKNQNPYWAYKNDISEWFIYNGYKKSNKKMIFGGVALNKINYWLFHMLNKISAGKYKRIYACHGSFFILRKTFVNECMFKFDEEMFLFYEEAYLALKAKQLGLYIEYCKDILICHKEDGSMNMSGLKEYPYLRDSYIYYYEKYKQKV